ncbi:Map kinase kinase kinase win1 [Lasiodiplodia theobromae]|uniref:Map kinase kinase kinase win1 n=1 Tax=Lasiodiplodia theobromae TaxID=45133 RepID=UPI0015C2F66A|nr:Map kinase kinase kinase win1 [Lasiodiplodia theobromae]KAF4545468.1 Map kinase kinase kinase win1 [Lasiodiplodia theobromae]
MDLSKVRIGNLIAEGESATVWNASITKRDSEGNGTNKACILKMFKSNEAFINETAAHGRITEISALEDRVPHYYGLVPHLPRSILLGKHDGEILQRHIWNIRQGFRDLVKSKVTETLKMLHECGVSHGDITTKNIMFQTDANVKLVHFSHADLKEDVEEEFIWRNCMSMDKCDVSEIFHEVESAKAHEEATHLLNSVRNGTAIVAPQERLAILLDHMGCPEEEVLDFIMDVFERPKPILALPLAECLASDYHHYTKAIEILTEAASRFDTPSLPISQENTAFTMRMKIAAARHVARIEGSYMDDALPPSHDRYEDVIRFYLRFVDGAKPADKVVLELRYELAKHLHSCYLRHVGHAMDVCVRALEEAKWSGGEVLLGHLKNYCKLIEAAKEHLALDIHSNRKHMWEGKEHGWARWARLPMLEQAFHRATEARRLCNHLWAERQVEGDPRTIWALPVDWMLEDYA